MRRVPLSVVLRGTGMPVLRKRRGNVASGRARKEQPSRRLIAAPAFAALLAVLGCGRCGASSSGVVARFDGGQISLAEFQAESSRLPPALRVEFESPRGRREFLAAMVDKRLLAGEARRQGIADDPSLRRQVQEFEDRLIVQTLLERAEKSAPSLTEAEARAWFGQHSREFAQPERVRVRRILASWGTAGPTAGRNAARDRAERLAGRLSRGEPFEKVAADGEGPERFHAGEMGILLRGSGDPDLERVAFGLASVGAVSAPFASPSAWRPTSRPTTRSWATSRTGWNRSASGGSSTPSSVVFGAPRTFGSSFGRRSREVDP
jgi:hypothetical protein